MRERAAQLRHPQRKPVQRRYLRHKRLGRRDPDLDAGARQKHTVGLLRGLASGHIRQRQDIAPRSRARRMAASVSAVSPDCVMPMTSESSSSSGAR